MSYNSPWTRRLSGKVRRQILVVLVGLCILVSFTSAGQTPFLRTASNTKSQSSITVTDPEYSADNHHLVPETIKRSGQRFVYPSAESHQENEAHRRFGSSTTTASLAVDSWDRSSADTCGGTVNVPLSFDRLTTFESSQFPEERAYPLICTWNVKVPNKKCGLARITMRVDGRSRLPDVDGCTKGYYHVYPFMKEAKICGRIGDVSPFQWYVDVQQPENVTIVMENIGLSDRNPEGLSFTLQGECVDDMTMRIDKENFRFSRRWINRLMEDEEAGDGPRVTINSKSGAGLNRQTTVTPLRTTTTPSTTTTTTTQRPAISNGDNIPWFHLQSPESNHPTDSVIYFPPSSTTKTIRRTSSTTVRPPTTYLNHNQDIPWLILKSPQQADDSSSFEIYPHKNDDKQNDNNVKQTQQETTLSTKNPYWLALKSAYLRNVTLNKSTPSPSYTKSYYSKDQMKNSRSPLKSQMIVKTKVTPDPLVTKTEFVPTTGPLILTSLPTTTIATPTTSIAETTPNVISYSTQQQQSTTLNQNEFNSVPTFPASKETTATTTAVTSPAPTEPSLDEVSPENDANVSYISLNGQKFIFSKLQRMFKRTYDKLRKIMY